jgi:hypothetical protein
MRPTPSNAVPPSEPRLCYRQPGEPWDERPALFIRPFWRDEQEALAYLQAVKDNPREVDVEGDSIESSMHYIVRLAGIVQRGPLGPAVRRFPTRREEKARPVKQEPPYEERLAAIFREPGEEG